MKILLAAVNAKYIHSNLAVFCLKAFAEEQLAEEAPQIAIAEYTINQQTDEILRDIFQKKPDVVCFSCYIWNRMETTELAAELKKILPQTKIWFGGPEVSYDGIDFLHQNPAVDGVMKGEGEQTFTELLKLWRAEERADYSKIQGIVYREEETTGIVENEWRPVMDLSHVPFVYQDIALFEHKIIYYESSRGCPFSCSYCLSSVDKCLRFRDLELVKKELQFFIDHKIPQVKFVDRTFNCKHDHAMTIWNYIKEHDNGVTNFHFEISADLLNEEELCLLETFRPGLAQFEIGVQSTNPETIREIRRTMKLEQVKDRVLRINSFGNIHQHLDLIAGLPFEDYESFGRSFDEVYALAPEQLQLGFLKVLKGSYMEENKEAYALTCKSRPPYEVLTTKWLPYEDTLRLKKIEEMVEVYYNSRQFCMALPQLIKEFDRPFQFFESLAEFYFANGFGDANHTRTTRYEILLKYAENLCPEKGEKIRQLLVMDYYLRENAKTRPEFAGEETISKEFGRAFYDEEAQLRNYLKGYESFEKRKIRKMTHLEAFDYQVLADGAPGKCVVLFDYQNRNPLNHQAQVYEIPGGKVML